jgi:hypothetical protein
MPQSLIELLNNPLLYVVLGAYWLFSAAVGAMDTPAMTDPEWKRYAFRFLHRLAGNLNRAAVAFKVPGAKENGDGPKT